MENKLWTEKYRPINFGDVVGQEAIVERVKAFVENKNMPHLLFSGPAGVGKTALALVAVRSLYGKEWRNNFLETNASDERGIDVIRHKVKDFARTRAIGTDLPKIIYLDECDSLTKEAQQALRRTMESYSNTARFILSCNFSSKIIDPIQSRCTVFRFRPLDKGELKKIVDKISATEGLKLDDEVCNVLYDLTGGDARRTTNILQSCAAVDKKITKDLLYSVVSAARPVELKNVLELAVGGEFVKARDSLLKVMLEHGLSGLDVIKNIQREVLNLEIEDKKKLEYVIFCGEVEFRMVEGSDEFIQLESFLAKICTTAK
tara:strand:- start:2876 stop:3829 length:954 start_codon:yes stop_codon:yes gene_type:complete